MIHTGLCVFVCMVKKKMANETHQQVNWASWGALMSPCPISFHVALSCLQAVSASEAVATLLLSPLSLYAWFTSTLLRLLLSLPALLLTSTYHSLLLLLLAWPCSLLSICAALALVGLRLALYLLHLALALAAVAVLSGMCRQNAATGGEQACQPKTPETPRSRTRLKLSGRRVVQQG